MSARLSVQVSFFLLRLFGARVRVCARLRKAGLFPEQGWRSAPSIVVVPCSLVVLGALLNPLKLLSFSPTSGK